MEIMEFVPILMMVMIVGLVVWRRLRAASRPIKGSGYKILLPLVFLALGLMGFMNPNLHMTVREVLLSLLFGAVLSIPMIMTTNYEVREDGQVYTRRSKAFFIALIGLVVLRLGLREYLSDLDPAELGMLFWLIAVAYVVPWRVVSFMKFRRFYAQIRQGNPGGEAGQLI